MKLVKMTVQEGENVIKEGATVMKVSQAMTADLVCVLETALEMDNVTKEYAFVNQDFKEKFAKKQK